MLAVVEGSGTSELRWKFDVVAAMPGAGDFTPFHAEFPDDCS